MVSLLDTETESETPGTEITVAGELSGHAAPDIAKVAQGLAVKALGSANHIIVWKSSIRCNIYEGAFTRRWTTLCHACMVAKRELLPIHQDVSQLLSFSGKDN